MTQMAGLLAADVRAVARDAHVAAHAGRLSWAAATAHVAALQRQRQQLGRPAKDLKGGIVPSAGTAGTALPSPDLQPLDSAEPVGVWQAGSGSKAQVQVQAVHLHSALDLVRKRTATEVGAPQVGVVGGGALAGRIAGAAAGALAGRIGGVRRAPQVRGGGLLPAAGPHKGRHFFCILPAVS